MSGYALDLCRWPRREHFEHFLAYDQPFFSLCAPIPIGPTLDWCRQHQRSPALATWWACLKVIHALEPMRYRLRPGGQVWVHDRVWLSVTTPGPQQTFRFCTLEMAADLATFEADARQRISAAASAPLRAQVEPLEERRDAVVYGSMLPWLDFTSVSHARRSDPLDSVPRLAFGRHTQREGQRWMSASLEVHHALMDGLHASQFFALMEDALTRPEDTFASSSPGR